MAICKVNRRELREGEVLERATDLGVSEPVGRTVATAEQRESAPEARREYQSCFSTSQKIRCRLLKCLKI